MPSFRAHSLRFYKVEPKAITCLAHSPTSPLLALARSDSTVEVWSTKHTLVMQRIIHPEPHTESVSVESLAWGGDRLYSCGLHGQVVEYDLEKLCEARRHAVTSGPAWCLAIDKGGNKMAVGTEEGFVCLFNLTADGLDYNRVLDRQEGRILCLAWHSDGVHIATGSTDTIRVWNIETGHPTARMTTGRTERNKETIVWCVAITSDMTVISGDSRGKTSFWNGKNGTLVDSVQSHKADVLTLAVSGDEGTAYSSGVDPTLMHFQVILKGDGRRKWVKSLHRVISTHDVRSVVCVGNTLYSGGVDSYLSVSSYPTHRTTVKVPHLPTPGSVSIARQARCVLMTYRDRLELWRLGSTSYSTGGIGAVLPLDSEPVKVVELGVKKGEVVVCSAVHSSGEWMAYSTTARVRLLRVEGVLGGTPKLRRVAVPDEDIVHHMALYSVGGEVRLLVCPRDGGVSVYSLTEDSVTLLHTATSTELNLTGGIARMSHTDSVCVLADYEDGAVCLDLTTNNLVSKLPGYTEATLASLGLSFDSKTCVLVYSNNRMMEVDLKTGRYTQFSKDLSSRLPRGWLSRRTAVTNVVHIEGNSDIILLHDHSILATVDKDKDLPEPSSKLFFSDPRSTPDTLTDTVSVSSFGSQHTSGSRLDQTLSSGLRMSRKYDHLMALHHLAGDEIVAVEVKPSVLESQLPPSLKQKKFGGS